MYHFECYSICRSDLAYRKSYSSNLLCNNNHNWPKLTTDKIKRSVCAKSNTSFVRIQTMSITQFKHNNFKEIMRSTCMYVYSFHFE